MGCRKESAPDTSPNGAVEINELISIYMSLVAKPIKHEKGVYAGFSNTTSRVRRVAKDLTTQNPQASAAATSLSKVSWET